MKTVLITGCSSGFGLETAKYFLERDWNVIATMRTPREDVLPPSKNLRIIPLDVADADSIRSAVESAGPIDVLVNNAGIGLLNAVEGTPMEMIREIFETNTFGVNGNDAGGDSAVPRTKVGRRRKRHLVRDAEVSSAGVSLYGEQSRDQRLHRIARARAGAIWCAGQSGVAGPCSDNAVR